MRNFAKRIVLAYDADQAGQSAAASVYQWERQHEVDVAVAALPKGSDPAELAQKDPEALRRAVTNAVPFLQFRLERVLEHANVTTAEGRARAAELAMAVLAEHPSELVRDQYVMQVADRLRLDEAALRPRVAEMARNPALRATAASVPQPTPNRPRYSGAPMPRPGLEALRLCVHFPTDVKSRLIAQYFVNEVQSEIFEGLSGEKSLTEVIDEFDREYTDDDVTAVVSQLVRGAVKVELKNVERDLREGRMTPEVAIATIRDVKERVGLLETDQGLSAEKDLREWLVERSLLVRS
jgi:DNA primase